MADEFPEGYEGIFEIGAWVLPRHVSYQPPDGSPELILGIICTDTESKRAVELKYPGTALVPIETPEAFIETLEWLDGRGFHAIAFDPESGNAPRILPVAAALLLWRQRGKG
jgi:hypothetical protein